MSAQPSSHPSLDQHSCDQPSCFIGIDVAKATLVIAHQGKLLQLPNRQRNLLHWLKSLPDHCAIALEATNTYHQLLANLALAVGHAVYLLNPKQLKHYRTATATRAKTDSCDAVLIARYLEREYTQLHPYVPLPQATQQLCSLLRRRACVVKSKTQLRLSWNDWAEQAKELGLSRSFKTLLNQHEHLLKAIDAKIIALLQLPQHRETAKRLQSVVGIGPLSGAALLVALQRGTFESADAFVAFLGLDPIPKDSGQSSGRRRLSKQGDSETRRLLFTAALSASSTKIWKPFYQRYLEKGLSPIQALCILARKLARLAWTLHKKQVLFCPEKLTNSLT